MVETSKQLELDYPMDHSTKADKDLAMSSRAKAQICFNLLTPDKAYPTLLYITFVTIQANPEITLSSLRKLLNREFLTPANTVDSLVGGLVSTSLFGAVTKWWDAGTPDIVKLRAASPPSPEMQLWVSDFCKQYPEMEYFHPVIHHRTVRHPPATNVTTLGTAKHSANK